MILLAIFCRSSSVLFAHIRARLAPGVNCFMHKHSILHREPASHTPTILLGVALLTTAFGWALMSQAFTVQRGRENQGHASSSSFGINSLDASAEMSLAATNA